MFKFLRARTRLLVATLAISGLLVGGLTAFLTSRHERFSAQATLAMLPGPEVPPEAALGFWEVLNRGQATRTAAMTLEDPRWSGAMSQETGILASEFTLSAAAIPETTLIEVSLQTSSAWAAERGLRTVITDGVPFAEKVSGPFTIETVSVEYARALSPSLIQQIGAFGLAGLLIGAGAGFLISRAAQGAEAGPDNQAKPTGPSSQISVLHGELSSAGRVEEPASAPKPAL